MTELGHELSRVESLPELAVKICSKLISGFEISEAEQRDLLALLNSLTDKSFISNSAFGAP